MQAIQTINDTNGITTGAIISIEQWECCRVKVKPLILPCLF